MKKTLMLMFLAATMIQADVHVPAAVALASAENKPQPDYNPLARQMRVVGDVSVEVQIATSGDVDSVKVLAGNALLAGPVVKTVKTWKFKPFLQSGQPTVAVTVLRFTFK